MLFVAFGHHQSMDSYFLTFCLKRKRFHLESLKMCQIFSLWKFQLNKDNSPLPQWHYNFFPKVLFLNLLELRNNYLILVFKQVCITLNIFISCQCVLSKAKKLAQRIIHPISQHKCEVFLPQVLIGMLAMTMIMVTLIPEH